MFKRFLLCHVEEKILCNALGNVQSLVFGIFVNNDLFLDGVVGYLKWQVGRCLKQ